MKPESVRHPGTAAAPTPRRNTSKACDIGEPAAPVESLKLMGAHGLTPEGKVRLIVSFDSAAEAQAARESCADCVGGWLGEDLPLVNGFTAEVPPRQLSRLLKSLPEGSHVALDKAIEFPDARRLLPKQTGNSMDRDPIEASSSIINIQKVWDRGFTGKGQTIAVIDSGIHPHADLKDKIVGWVDMAENKAEPVDTFGHGTHVAGVAAGSGAKSAGRFKGIAPDAEVVGVRITSVAEAIKGIQWVIENKERYNIGVLNMSLGDFATRSYKDDPWAQAAQKAMEAGLTVVVAAGNEGPSEGSVSTPGTHPDLITVGALDDKRTIDRSDDQVADFSSRGPTAIDGLSKPDLLAPGVGIFGPLAPGATLDVPELPHVGQDYFAISGTSMATPMVAGVAAVLRQANPELSHKDIKEILVQSASRYLKDDSNVQGAGLVDAAKALDLALAWPEGRQEPKTVAAAVPAPPAMPSPEEGFLFTV